MTRCYCRPSARQRGVPRRSKRHWHSSGRWLAVPPLARVRRGRTPQADRVDGPDTRTSATSRKPARASITSTRSTGDSTSQTPFGGQHSYQLGSESRGAPRTALGAAVRPMPPLPPRSSSVLGCAVGAVQRAQHAQASTSSWMGASAAPHWHSESCMASASRDA